jgi:TonB family protein
MKKLFLVFFLFSVVSVFAQTDDKATLKQLNQNLVSSYKNNKLDDAMKFANQAVQLSLKIYGIENVESAVAYSNLGFIQREKKKYSESIISFQKSIDIYSKMPNLKGAELVDAYENLALSQFLNQKYDSAIACFLKAIELAETKFGKESKILFSPTLNLANTYLKDNKFEKADEFYLKSTRLALKHFGEASLEFLRIDFLRNSVCNKNKERDDSYIKARKEIIPQPSDSKLPSVISAGMVNGKAKYLAKPDYPSEAREKRLSGTVTVKVLIDEEGNVVYAQSECGRGVLGDSAENAALKSKFEPTILGGKPIKYNGIVTYKFISQ